MELYQKQESVTEKTEVIIRVDKIVMQYINGSRKYYGFVSEKIAGDKVEMTFMANEDCDGLARWYMMFCDQAEIVRPESFRQKVIGLIEQAAVNININKEPAEFNLPVPHRQIQPVADF